LLRRKEKGKKKKRKKKYNHFIAKVSIYVIQMFELLSKKIHVGKFTVRLVDFVGL
jgi:hypothetical protein